jgi:hypothetical protein
MNDYDIKHKFEGRTRGYTLNERSDQNLGRFGLDINSTSRHHN